MVLLENTSKKCTFETKSILEVEKGSNLIGQVKKGDNVWIIPLRWNQGCFDLLLYDAGKVAVFQFTIALKHDFKLSHLAEFLKHLPSSSLLSIYALIPSLNAKKFLVSSCKFTDVSSIQAKVKGWKAGLTGAILCSVDDIAENPRKRKPAGEENDKKKKKKK